MKLLEESWDYTSIFAQNYYVIFIASLIKSVGISICILKTSLNLRPAPTLKLNSLVCNLFPRAMRSFVLTPRISGLLTNIKHFSNKNYYVSYSCLITLFNSVCGGVEPDGDSVGFVVLYEMKLSGRPKEV